MAGIQGGGGSRYSPSRGSRSRARQLLAHLTRVGRRSLTASAAAPLTRRCCGHGPTATPVHGSRARNWSAQRRHLSEPRLRRDAESRKALLPWPGHGRRGHVVDRGEALVQLRDARGRRRRSAHGRNRRHRRPARVLTRARAVIPSGERVWRSPLQLEPAIGYAVGMAADSSFCQSPNSFPSVSLQIENQPMPGTGMASPASPPSSLTRAAPALTSSTSK